MFTIEITQPNQDKPYLILEAKTGDEARRLAAAYEAQGDHTAVKLRKA